MFKKCGLVITIISIICLLLYLIPWQYKINTTMPGIQCRIGNTKYTEVVTITIKGVYKNYLIKNDTFHGSIFIDKYEFTSDSSEVSLHFNDGWSSLSYLKFINGFPNINTLGTIICTPKFKRILINISEPLNQDSRMWNAYDGLFISAPAKTRNQAIHIAESLSSRSSWLSKTKWY